MQLSGRTLTVLYACCMALYLVLITISVPRLTEYAGGIPPLDMRALGFSTHDVSELFHALGPEGRTYYLTPQLLLDTFYPGLFAISYSLITLRFIALLNLDYLHLGRLSLNWKLLAFPALLGGLCDYIENLSTLALLQLYPRTPTSMVTIGSCANIVKNAFYVIAICIFLILGLALLVQKWRSKSKNLPQS